MPARALHVSVWKLGPVRLESGRIVTARISHVSTRQQVFLDV